MRYGQKVSPSSLLWRRAYAIAVINAALFVFLSVGNIALGFAPITFSAAIAIVFFAGSVASFIMLVRSGGEIAAVSYFVLGTGGFFGFGTAYSTVIDEPVARIIFSPDEQANALPAVNLVNSISVLIVLLIAWLLCRQGPNKAMGVAGLRSTISLILPFQIPLLLLATFVTVLRLLTFPIPSNLIVRGLLNYVSVVPVLAVMLIGFQWSRLKGLQRALSLSLVFLLVSVEVLSFSKTFALMPLVAMGIGLLLDRHSRKSLSFYAIFSIAVYFLVIAPICNYGRTYPEYSADENTIFERFSIVAEIVATLSPSSAPLGQGPPLLQRFSAAPIQAFLIKRYDAGTPGDSLSDAWVALVPRFLWSNKPNVTRFGTQLDTLFFNRDFSESGLAPSYSAEAYWNYGWVGVSLVSILVGLQVGWFTRKWNMFTRDARKHFGILIFAIPILMSYGWVETWVVAKYVGGFVTLLIMVMIVDFCMPLLLLPKDANHFRRQVFFVARRGKANISL